MTSPADSAPPSTRIQTLDFARGMAILGILLMNISGFGLAKAAYLNPAYAGTPSLSDAWTWAVLAVVAQAKFLSLFALLFGAGLQLLKARGTRWINVRLSWLMLFGVVHGIFFWDGDILLTYGLVGLLCWPLIREGQSSRKLLQTGAVLYLCGVAVLVLLWVITPAANPGRFWLPGLADLDYEKFWKLQGGPEAWSNRLDMLKSNLIAVAVQYGWELAGLMLVGAGLMRNGWLRGEFSPQHYRRMALILLPLPLLIQSANVALQWHLEWDYAWCGFLLQVPVELMAPLQGLGYLALCYAFWPRLQSWRLSQGIAAIGRMALSNYLLQTLLATLIFYHFGAYQHFDRLTLLTLVPAIWLANLLFSLCWLHFFAQGPVEWLWRKLTARVATSAKISQ